MALKYENLAEIGDLIKAFDFEPIPGREPCFVIGKVVAKGRVYMGFDAFTIEVSETGGPCNRDGAKVFVPFECSMTEWDGRVTRLKSAAQLEHERQQERATWGEYVQAESY